MQKLFNPQSVALIGATDRAGSVGLGIAENLWLGKKQRKIFFVNPNSKKVLKQKTYASIAEIKEKIDLAIIAVPAKFVKQVSLECCLAGAGCCIIISSGFAETGLAGETLQKEISEIFAKNNIPLVGPNCLGVINPHKKLNASFAPDTPQPGKIAFLSQSGALIDSVIDYSLLENLGFSLMVSYGNEAGLGLNDFLAMAGEDKNTKVIAVYLEEIKNGQDFIKIASEIAKQKPIIILKGGKTPAGNKAAQSHTAAMAGEAKIYSAAFQKAGVLEVETIEDLFLVSRTRADLVPKRRGLPLSGSGWAILTNGGAVGVITADWCSRLGVKLAEIALQNNPWDVLGDATSEIYQTALLALLKQPDISGVIFCQTLQTMTDPWQNAKIIIKTQKQYPQKPILPLFLGGVKTKKAVDLLKQAGLGCFQEPRDAVMIASLLLTSDVNSR
ncbi:hypothetical protein COU03_01695 [bacterium (Candidatus Gribaldobacteria) CG10_big_fil_rev_8_21_14_0_10_41_12]|uniref:CoA-binding domain-containing protein n=1 Tax=bacterium (Candidatus Gribaldobacteria) CG10_big_fil_rev_8_21_14_0_10_41_12 TaxID=2014277 RepID=A0A2H0UXI9_9BACT|nr:MAG: hypothetical protein COU03_01695 [bacterium (Candidatus Gribaldobacteria) CG10_big_fil_rev_8_21_14_0_10_41_12]